MINPEKCFSSGIGYKKQFTAETTGSAEKKLHFVPDPSYQVGKMEEIEQEKGLFAMTAMRNTYCTLTVK